MPAVLTPGRLRALAAASLLLLGGPARAEPGEPPDAPRVYHVPTAWLQPSGGGFATAGANHRGGMVAAAVAGLGGLAEIDVGILDDVNACTVCEGNQREAVEMYIPTAQLKIGLAQGRFAGWQPAFALGFRRSLGAIERTAGGARFDPELAHMFVAVSWRVSRLELHAGAEMWDAVSRPEGTALHDASLGEQVRGFGAATWRSRRYPRTTLMLDFGWAPELRDPAPRLAWLGGFGVRYQALSWASAEIGVRARESEAENLTAFLRVNASWR